MDQEVIHECGEEKTIWSDMNSELKSEN
jgi:hypothetical protein